MSKGSVTYTECASYLHKAGNVSNGNVKYTEYANYLQKECRSSKTTTKPFSPGGAGYTLNFYRKALLFIRSKDRLLLLTSKSLTMV